MYPGMMQFKSATLSNRRGFKKVPWQITVPKALIEGRPVLGSYVFPVDEVSLSIESGPDNNRMTATRVLAGGALFGPVGAILGGMMRKDTTYFALVFETTHGTFRIPFSKHEWSDAQEFIRRVVSCSRVLRPSIMAQ